MKTKRHEIAEFAAILARELPNESPYAIGELVNELMLQATKHQRVCENYCNGYYPTDAAYDAAIDRPEQRIWRLLRTYHDDQIRPVFQHDPRGATVKVRVPSGYTNDWGREGVCVPARG